MSVRWPAVRSRLGLGVGLDLPWGAPIGFGFDARRRVDEASPRVIRFLDRHASDFSHLFVSWQPRDRNRLDARDYIPAYDDLFARTPQYTCRALHHTALNLGALERYERGAIVEFTNVLIDRYGLQWVNEDLGLWSLGGRPLPYPLPPYLDARGLRASIDNTAFVQSHLAAPLLVEFPGFSEGTSFFIGRLDAYDFFREVVVETDSPCTIDTGHLLSYRWLQGARGEALYDRIDRLPTANCFEIHLSGCAISNDRFMDFHHGILMDEQIELLERLLPLCSNVCAITYEDPKFDEAGVLIPKARHNFERLQDVVRAWTA